MPWALPRPARRRNKDRSWPATPSFKRWTSGKPEPLNRFISSGAEGVANYVSTPLTSALTLYVIIYGFLILRGSIRDPMMEFAFRAIKLGAIVMLVRSSGDYQTNVADLFFNSIPQEIGSALNSGTTTSASAFDSLLDQGQAVAQVILQKASSWPACPLIGLNGPYWSSKM